MPNWTQVLNEINGLKSSDPIDAVRRKYLDKLFNYRKRNVISYYSGWLQKPNIQRTSIDDDDKNGFMATIHELDKSLGLDLLLHTPGGDAAATESLIDYLHRIFHGDIVAFVPQIAMSGGTMMACSCKEIYMGKHSNIGPIDPLLGNASIPAFGVIQEFETILKEIKKDPDRLHIWRPILEKYSPSLIGTCKNAIQLSDEIVRKRLTEVMFKDETDAAAKVNAIIKRLNEHSDNKTHARHIHIDEAKEAGLKITDLESDKELQDLILTIHHCYMQLFGSTKAIKAIENHNGIAIIMTERKKSSNCH